MERDDNQNVSNAKQKPLNTYKLSELIAAAADAFARNDDAVKNKCWQIFALQQCLKLHFVHINHLYKSTFPHIVGRENFNQLNMLLTQNGLRSYVDEPLTETQISVNMVDNVVTIVKVMFDVDINWRQDKQQTYKDPVFPISGNRVEIVLHHSSLIAKGSGTITSHINTVGYSIKLVRTEQGFSLVKIKQQTEKITKKMNLPAQSVRKSELISQYIDQEYLITQQAYKRRVHLSYGYGRDQYLKINFFKVIVQPNIYGKDLSELITEKYFATQHSSLIFMVMVNLACGLQRLHAMQTIHLDFKPGNVKLGTNGYPVILDFGYAEMRGKGQIIRKCSSPQYATPARLLYQFNKKEESPSPLLSPELDIYSLAVTYLKILGVNIALKLPKGLTFEGNWIRDGKEVTLAEKVNCLHECLLAAVEELIVDGKVKNMLTAMLAKESSSCPTLANIIAILISYTLVDKNDKPAGYDTAYNVMYWHLICTEVFVLAMKLSALTSLSENERKVIIALKEMAYVNQEFNDPSPEQDKIIGQYKYEQLISYLASFQYFEHPSLEKIRTTLTNDASDLSKQYDNLRQVHSGYGEELNKADAPSQLTATVTASL